MMERRPQEQASTTNFAPSRVNVKWWKWRVPKPRVPQMTSLIILFALFKDGVFHKNPWQLFRNNRIRFKKVKDATEMADDTWRKMTEQEQDELVKI
jgi:hypothetical protein